MQGTTSYRHFVTIKNSIAVSFPTRMLSDMASQVMQQIVAIYRSVQITCADESTQLVKNDMRKRFFISLVLSSDSSFSRLTKALSLQLEYLIILQSDRLFYPLIDSYKLFTINFDFLGFHVSVLTISQSNHRYLPKVLITCILQTMQFDSSLECLIHKNRFLTNTNPAMRQRARQMKHHVMTLLPPRPLDRCSST